MITKVIQGILPKSQCTGRSSQITLQKLEERTTERGDQGRGSLTLIVLNKSVVKVLRDNQPIHFPTQRIPIRVFSWWQKTSTGEQSPCACFYQGGSKRRVVMPQHSLSLRGTEIRGRRVPPSHLQG